MTGPHKSHDHGDDGDRNLSPRNDVRKHKEDSNDYKIADCTETTSRDGDSHNDLGGEAAGVVRGVSRSVVRAPWVGRLPRPAPPKSVPIPKSMPRAVPRSIPRAVPRGVPKNIPRGVPKTIPRSIPKGVPKAPPSAPSIGRGVARQRVPIRRVARFSDRVSTGLDVFNSAVESNEQQQQPQQSKQIISENKQLRLQWAARIRSFAFHLVRNTLLGMAVFESYGLVVTLLAPSTAKGNAIRLERMPSTSEVIDSAETAQDLLTIDPTSWDEATPEYDKRVSVVDDETDEEIIDEPDDYARASLAAHWGAGALAGTVHGVATTFMEGNPPNLGLFNRSTPITSSPSPNFSRFLIANTTHHAVAHAMLFGSYEGIKRFGLHQIRQLEARGVTSSNSATPYLGVTYLGIFGLAGGFAGSLQHVVSHYMEAFLGLSTIRAGLPPLRPCLMAFPPSAIGFIAFEYGKTFTT